MFGHSYSYVVQWSNQSGKISDQGWKWIRWPRYKYLGNVGHFYDHAGLICKLNHLDVIKTFNRSHVLENDVGIWYLGLVMHWTIIGMKPAYYLKLFWIRWCPEISFSRIPCVGPDLYAAKKEEIYGIVSYLISSIFTLLLKEMFSTWVTHRWVLTSGFLCGSVG